MEFPNALQNWYLENRRDLPWRSTRDPYHIWLSEIMLQQTRVEQGLPYYTKFIEAFPKVEDLAAASSEKVLKLWQGLGYYSRARNLHETAKYVAYELNGKFPGSYKELLKLKGVGDYTASAIASFCYNEKVALVDGNVFRVVSRLKGIETPINTTEGKKLFKKLAEEALEKVNFDRSTYNQAIMEFGALHCKPANPACEVCPFNEECVALRTHKIKDLPVKLRKTRVKKRYFNYLVLETGNEETAIEKRTGKGIWHGLYQFPLVETEKKISEKELRQNELFRQYIKEKDFSVEIFNPEPVIHKLSHQHLYATFWRVQVMEQENTVPLESISAYPVPVLIQNFLNEYLPEDYK
ncbi:MAG: A/G-specific adenine glycosylase [Christiangramia sp.]|nr:A/G-specific adenine glycosylase [Christiangramia sp.]